MPPRDPASSPIASPDSSSPVATTPSRFATTPPPVPTPSNLNQRTEPPRGAKLLTAAPIFAGFLAALLLAWLEPVSAARADQIYEIPEGTAARVDAGADLEALLPPQLRTQVGTRLVVANNDVASHVFGPFVLQPDQTWSLRFALPGEYGFACSVYPEVGLTIQVDPSPEESPLATWLVRGSFAMLFLLAAIVAGSLGVTSATGTWPGGAWFGAALALPGAAFAMATIHATALARFTPWRDVFASRALPGWFAAVSLAVVAYLLAGFIREGHSYRPQLIGLMAVLGVVVVAAGASPIFGLRSVTLGLAGLGVGLLAASTWQALRGTRVPVWPLAFSGLCLTLLGLPWPLPTAPGLAAAALALLAVGVAHWGIVTRRGGRMVAGNPELAAVVGLSGAILLVSSFGSAYAAVVRYQDAVSIPVAGNTVPADADSIARGARIWEARCQECHEIRPSVRHLDDRAALSVIARGVGEMPGLGYELDQELRGDVLNFLRSLE